MCFRGSDGQLGEDQIRSAGQKMRKYRVRRSCDTHTDTYFTYLSFQNALLESGLLGTHSQNGSKTHFSHGIAWNTDLDISSKLPIVSPVGPG